MTAPDASDLAARLARTLPKPPRVLVYRDPVVPPKGQPLLAYIPEVHRSRGCERALRGGQLVPRDPEAPACELCMGGA